MQAVFIGEKSENTLANVLNFYKFCLIFAQIFLSELIFACVLRNDTNLSDFVTVISD